MENPGIAAVAMLLIRVTATRAPVAIEHKSPVILYVVQALRHNLGGTMAAGSSQKEHTVALARTKHAI